MIHLGRFLGLLCLALTVFACGERESTSSYEQQVMQERVQRDMQMREKNSVLPPNRRASFKGLSYYDVDSTYRFVIPLRRRSTPDTVLLGESTGRVGAQVRVGQVTVPFPAGEEELTVFRGTGDDPRGRLWIPFADATNGDSTYKAGRYVDLQRAGGDSVVVDFNRAYNPTCAYNPEYACPLPPKENQMDIPVPVGEKKPMFAETGSS